MWRNYNYTPFGIKISEGETPREIVRKSSGALRGGFDCRVIRAYRSKVRSLWNGLSPAEGGGKRRKRKAFAIALGQRRRLCLGSLRRKPVCKPYGFARLLRQTPPFLYPKRSTLARFLRKLKSLLQGWMNRLYEQGASRLRRLPLSGATVGCGTRGTRAFTQGIEAQTAQRFAAARLLALCGDAPKTPHPLPGKRPGQKRIHLCMPVKHGRLAWQLTGYNESIGICSACRACDYTLWRYS